MRVGYFRRGRLVAGLGWLAFVVGCGPAERPIGDVFGTVEFKGKPVTAGFVKFVPEAGGEPVAGAIAADGSYRVSGVPAGRCKVAVETKMFRNRTAPPPALAKQMAGPHPSYVAIPDKYETTDSSGLTYEVKRGDNTFPLTLTD